MPFLYILSEESKVLEDVVHEIIDGREAVVEDSVRCMMYGGCRFLCAYTGTNLFYIRGRRIALVIAGNGTRNADLFRRIDDNNPVAEGVQSGFIENGGFEKEGRRKWWIDKW